MTPLKSLALALGIIALPLASHAGEICDFESHCYADGASNPDLETPPPAPQYPSSAGQSGRDITVQPNACRLFRMRSVPNIEPLIVELCPVSPEEERAIRARASGAVGADVGQPVQ